MSAETPSPDSGNLWVVVPFVLAVGGTVVMLFNNSATMLKVSLVLALWAAVAGLIVMNRLKRDRDVAQRELEDRDKLHAAELEAASARVDADNAALALAISDGHHASDGKPTVDLAILREIQEELQALRTQLEELSGRQFVYEPAAVRAEARRIAELAAGDREVAQPQDQQDEQADDQPSAAQTARIEPVRDAEEPKRASARPFGAPTSDAIAGRLGAQPSARARQYNPLSQLISERQAQEAARENASREDASREDATREDATREESFRFESFTTDSFSTGSFTPERASSAPEPEPEPEPIRPARHGGRRRRDEGGANSISVADLLARRAKDQDR